MMDEKIFETELETPGPSKRQYIDIPRSRYIAEEEFGRYILEEDMKKYDLRQEMLERFDIESIQSEGKREEGMDVINSIIDDRISELRSTFEKRLREEIEKISPKSKPKREERLNAPFKW